MKQEIFTLKFTGKLLWRLYDKTTQTHAGHPGGGAGWCPLDERPPLLRSWGQRGWEGFPRWQQQPEEQCSQPSICLPIPYASSSLTYNWIVVQTQGRRNNSHLGKTELWKLRSQRISMRLFLLRVSSVLCLTRRERHLSDKQPLGLRDTVIKWSVWDTEATIIQVGVHGNWPAKIPHPGQKDSLITPFGVATSPSPPDVGFNHYEDIYFLGFFLVNDFFLLEHLLLCQLLHLAFLKLMRR